MVTKQEVLQAFRNFPAVTAGGDALSRFSKKVVAKQYNTFQGWAVQLGNFTDPTLLSDESLNFICDYLDEKKDESVNLGAFSEIVLNKIKSCLPYLTKLRSDSDRDIQYTLVGEDDEEIVLSKKAPYLVQAILHDASDQILRKNVLGNLDNTLLDNAPVIAYLNQKATLSVSSLEELIDVLNVLTNASPQDMQNLDSNLPRYKKCLTRLRALNIDFGVNFLDWIDPISAVPNDWFPLFYNIGQENILETKRKLESRLFSLDGVKYVLKNLPYAKLGQKAIEKINSLIKKLTTDGSTPNHWAMIENCFFANLRLHQTFAKIDRMNLVYPKIPACREETFATFLIKFLFLNDDFFKSEEALTDPVKFIALDPRFFSQQGSDLYLSLKNAGIKITEEYLEALNDIISKPELTDISDLKFLVNQDQLELNEDIKRQLDALESKVLNDLKALKDLKVSKPLLGNPYIWLSESGLKMLNSFDVSFLTKRGLKYISRLDLEKVSQSDIQNLNSAPIDWLLRIAELNPFISVSDEVLTAVKLRELKKYTQQKVRVTVSAELMRINKEVITESLASDECRISFQKFIGDDSAIINSGSPITIELLNQHLILVKKSNGSYDIIKKNSYISDGETVADALNRAPKRHLVEDRMFVPDDFAAFTNENIDLDFLQFLLGLSESANIFHTFLYRCLSYPSFLAEIPQIIFTQKNLLSNINLSYLLNPEMLCYLKRFLQHNLSPGEELNEKMVNALNKISSDLQQKLKAIAGGSPTIATSAGEQKIEVVTILSKLEKGYFTVNHDDFLGIPNEYFKAPMLDKLMTWSQQSLPPQCISNVLKRIHPLYLQNKWLGLYLTEFLQVNIPVNADVIEYLNQQAEDLAQKFAAVNALPPGPNTEVYSADVIPRLPDVFFNRMRFRSFLNIPNKWFQVGLLSNLYKWSTYIDPETNNGAPAMKIPSESFDITYSFLKDLTFQDYQQLNGSNKDLLDRLISHSTDPKFPELVDVLFKNGYFTVEFCDLLNLKDTNQRTVCVKIYQFLLLNPDKARDVFTKLREKIKNDLLEGKQDRGLNLSELKDACKAAEDGMKDALTHFRPKFNEKNGQLQPALGLPQGALSAFIALEKAVNSANPFSALLHAIGKEKDNIPLAKPLFSRPLEFYTQKFNEASTNIFSQVYPTIYDKCKTNDDYLYCCLLDDSFYEIFPQEDKQGIASVKGELFYSILETYRLDDLHVLYEEASKPNSPIADIKRCYDKYCETHPRLVSKPAPAAPTDMTTLVDKPTATTTTTARTTATAETTSSQKSVASTPVLVPTTPRPVAQPKISNLPTLRRIQDKVRRYQLASIDISAGINILQGLLKDSLNGNSFSNAPAKNFVFFNPHRLDQRGVNDVFGYLKNVIEKNENKICYGVMNIEGMHWVSVFAYKPTNKPIQIIFIDPAFTDPASPSTHKSKTIQQIRALFKEQLQLPNMGSIQTLDIITQQFNDSECGLACLQNGEDVMLGNAISIEDGKMVLHRHLLTLDAERHIGLEEDFVRETAVMREKWESRLKGLGKVHYIPTGDESSSQVQSYSFEMNENLYLKGKKLELIFNETVACFINLKLDLRPLLDKEKQAVNFDQGAWKGLFNTEFKENCELFDQLLQEIQPLCKEDNSEPPYKPNALRLKLLQDIQSLHREARIAKFNTAFHQHLVTNSAGSFSELPTDWEDKYKNYCESEGEDWILEYQKLDTTFDHLKEVEKFLKANLKPKRQAAKVLTIVEVMDNEDATHNEDNQDILNWGKVSSHTALDGDDTKSAYSREGDESTDSELDFNNKPNSSNNSSKKPPLVWNTHNNGSNNKSNGLSFFESQPGSVFDYRSYSPFETPRLQNKPSNVYSSDMYRLLRAQITSLKTNLETFLRSNQNHGKARTLADSCVTWLNWIDGDGLTTDSLEKQKYFLVNSLYTSLNNERGGLLSAFQLQWSDTEYGGVLKKTLAKLLQISDQDYNLVNTGGKIAAPQKPGTLKSLARPKLSAGYEHLNDMFCNRRMMLETDIKQKFGPEAARVPEDLSLKNNHIQPGQ